MVVTQYKGVKKFKYHFWTGLLHWLRVVWSVIFSYSVDISLCFLPYQMANNFSYLKQIKRLIAKSFHFVLFCNMNFDEKMHSMDIIQIKNIAFYSLGPQSLFQTTASSSTCGSCSCLLSRFVDSKLLLPELFAPVGICTFMFVCWRLSLFYRYVNNIDLLFVNTIGISKMCELRLNYQVQVQYEIQLLVQQLTQDELDCFFSYTLLHCLLSLLSNIECEINQIKQTKSIIQINYSIKSNQLRT